MASAYAELDVVASIDDRLARVAISGELDIQTAPRFIATVHDIAEPPVKRVELNCEGVTFLDSAGVRALIVARNDASRRGVDVVLVERSNAVSRVLEMTGLDRLLTSSSA
jgi:anti-sigma B factor antagonist